MSSGSLTGWRYGLTLDQEENYHDQCDRIIVGNHKAAPLQEISKVKVLNFLIHGQVVQVSLINPQLVRHQPQIIPSEILEVPSVIS